jgi:hypothetical protein
MLTGSCFCKAIQYQVTSAVPLAVNCHCENMLDWVKLDENMQNFAHDYK